MAFRLWRGGPSANGVRACEVFFFGDVRALTGEQILDELRPESRDIDCVIAGPPCQGFSKAQAGASPTIRAT